MENNNDKIRAELEKLKKMIQQSQDEIINEDIKNRLPSKCGGDDSGDFLDGCGRVSTNGYLCSLNAGHLQDHCAHTLDESKNTVCNDTWHPITNGEFMQKNPIFGAFDAILNGMRHTFLAAKMSQDERQAVNILLANLYERSQDDTEILQALVNTKLNPHLLYLACAYKSTIMTLGNARKAVKDQAEYLAKHKMEVK